MQESFCEVVPNVGVYEMAEISIVVPLFNEEKVVQELYDRIKKVMTNLDRPFEIIFVDDGSSDGTYSIIEKIAENDLILKVVKLRSNFGQTAGIAAGIDHASGNIIIPMDGDLQHMPEDIPAFIEKIDQGYDVVSGWRKQRVDGLVSRRIPSKIANRLMRYLSGISLNDFGTTFKAYKRDVIEHVTLYGQLHRFIPVLCCGVMKIKICEIPIQNIERPVGKSNYGIWRTFTVFFDLIRLKFLMSFFSRPLQLFGSFGVFQLSLSGLILLFIGYARFFEGKTLASIGTSVFLLATTLGVAGIQFIFFGLIAELLVKLNFEGHRRRCYVVKHVLNELPRPLHPLNTVKAD